MGRKGCSVFNTVIFFIILFSPVLNLFAGKWNTGIDFGYDNGPGFYLYFSSEKFLSLKKTESRIGIGISFPDPGNPVLARKVFINDATNGIPEEKGRVYNFRFDLIKPLRLKIYPKSKFYFGIRYSMFKGMFKYSGGNEEFSITSNNFGIGFGTEHYFRLTKRKTMKVSAGIDYFFHSGIHGHDTTYHHNNENINPRNNYKFNDADKAVNQPKVEFRLMIGFTRYR